MSKRKLLLADDSVTIQKVVNLTFADEGIDVVTVGDGDAAMEKIAETNFDIVLADVNMPGVNGYEICRHIRESASGGDMPVVLLVGSFEPFDEDEAARVGANAYLTKPFQSIRQLVSQVTDLIDAAHTETARHEGTYETEAETVQPEIEDINSLYEQSVAETAELHPGSDAAREFVDAGMDDEMIEASYFGSGESPDIGLAAAAAEHFAGTETETRYDDVERITQAAEPEFGDHESSARSQKAYAFEESREESAAHYEHIADAEPINKEDVFSKETVEVPRQFSETPEESFVRQPENDPDDIFTFDEIDLLELPPAGSAKTIEFTTPENVIEAGGNKQVVSISPELMDIIVRKVAEKLSEKY